MTFANSPVSRAGLRFPSPPRCRSSAVNRSAWPVRLRRPTDAEIEVLGLGELADAQLHGPAHLLLVHLVRHETAERVTDCPHEWRFHGEIGPKVAHEV